MNGCNYRKKTVTLVKIRSVELMAVVLLRHTPVSILWGTESLQGMVEKEVKPCYLSWPCSVWGTPGAQNYSLKGYSPVGIVTINIISVYEDKTNFTFKEIQKGHAGWWKCHYCEASGCSEPSDKLKLLVTGVYSRPSLSALPSPVVPSGGNVTLQCGSSERFQGFVLIREGEPEFSWVQKSQPHPNGHFQAQFPVGPVVSGHNWTFSCYGYTEDQLLSSHSSDPLQLLVSDASGRPSLISLQGHIVTPGQNLILQCRSEVSYNTFALSKEGGEYLLQLPGHHTQAGLYQADFTLNHVINFHGGRYRCYGGHGLNPLWSEPSDPIDILVAGWLSYTPILSVDPGPLVSVGKNITLLCVSENWMDTFLLAKEGATNHLLPVRVDKTEKITKALFSFHPVTADIGGTYRCYSSRNNNPYGLSYPSASIQLQVSAVNLIRILLGGAVLLFLGILLLEARFCHSTIRG
ncbi:leukocyte immunoglobulin-like receptor subfamily A member 6 [Suncus etruscus]|uniref:leukocyte immunoglobulin-like receptor subfamily A member 6 n=1 Tax=Suncus etruscus TaxID=109475 RepID=UPI00210F5F77|nr:leukocyte immunoglobulin-like receptor subfamily A member 6 [Suncus etruscus]